MSVAKNASAIMPHRSVDVVVDPMHRRQDSLNSAFCRDHCIELASKMKQVYHKSSIFSVISRANEIIYECHYCYWRAEGQGPPLLLILNAAESITRPCLSPACGFFKQPEWN